MEKIIFTKETMNDQLTEALYAVESHMGGVYFDDDYSYDDDDLYCDDDPYYCDTCGDSDCPLGPIDTPLEMLTLLVERYDWREDIREMSDEEISDCLTRFIEEGGDAIAVEGKDFNDALQALIAYRESEKQNAGGEE